MNKATFDDMFDKAFDQAVKDFEFSPHTEASWNKVETQLIRRAKRKNLLRVLPVAVVAFVLGAFIFGSPGVTDAFNPIYHKLQTIQQNIETVLFGSDDGQAKKAKTKPPTDTAVTPVGQDVPADMAEHHYKTWDEAAPHLSFSPPQISFLPHGYELTIVQTMSMGDTKADNAVSIYTSPQNESLTITMRMISKNEKWASNYKEDAGKLEIIKINNRDAYVFVANDGTTSIEYLSGHLYISIVGSLSKEDLIRIAKNIK